MRTNPKKLISCLIVLCFLAACSSDKPKFVAVEGSGDPIDIRWDFSQAFSQKYTFEQVATSSVSTVAGAENDKIVLKGECRLKSEGDSKAALTVSGLKLDKSRTTNKNVQGLDLRDVTIKGFQEDGSFDSMDESQQFVLQAMLRLPTEAIAKGATEVAEVAIPTSLNGKGGELRGDQASTFVGPQDLSGVECLEVDTKFVYDRFMDKDGQESKVKIFHIDGWSTLYFNPETKKIYRCHSECHFEVKLGIASVSQIVEIKLQAVEG